MNLVSYAWRVDVKKTWPLFEDDAPLKILLSILIYSRYAPHILQSGKEKNDDLTNQLVAIELGVNHRLFYILHYFLQETINPIKNYNYKPKYWSLFCCCHH